MATPYDLIAERFVRERTWGRERGYVECFTALAPPEAHLLDLGCGTGRPIMRHLLDRGFAVTGVDTSAEMLRLARALCPEANFLLGDMNEIELGDTFGGIVAWDSVFHVPKNRQPGLFRALYGLLQPGAPLLISLGGSDDEFTAQMFGVEFFYSGFAPAVSLSLLRDCGFKIVLSEVDDRSSPGSFRCDVQETQLRRSGCLHADTGRTGSASPSLPALTRK